MLLTAYEFRYPLSSRRVSITGQYGLNNNMITVSVARAVFVRVVTYAAGCALSIQKCHVFAVGIFYLYYYYCYYFFFSPSPRVAIVPDDRGVCAFRNWMVRRRTPLGAACIFKTSFCSVWISHEEVEIRLLFAPAVRLRFAFVVFVRTHVYRYIYIRI